MSSFQITIQGQPPSVNHLYRIIHLKRGGKSITTLGKIPGVETYQDAATWATKIARPSGWQAGDRVRLVFSYFLSRDIDTDNTKKVLNDAIAKGLGVDDRIFLTCDKFKVLKDQDPRVLVEVFNEVAGEHSH